MSKVNKRQQTPNNVSLRPARILLALAAFLALGAGLWGLSAPRLDVSSSAAFHIGEFARVSGGLVRVDGVIPEHMAPMNMQGFAAVGMSMSAMGMDMAPEGYRRFLLEVTLVGQGNNGLHVTASQFRVTGEGLDDIFPIRYELGDGWASSGHTLAGSLVFQAPESATRLTLVFDTASIALELPPAEPHDDHSSGAGSD